MNTDQDECLARIRALSGIVTELLEITASVIPNGSPSHSRLSDLHTQARLLSETAIHMPPLSEGQALNGLIDALMARRKPH